MRLCYLVFLLLSLSAHGQTCLTAKRYELVNVRGVLEYRTGNASLCWKDSCFTLSVDNSVTIFVAHYLDTLDKTDGYLCSVYDGKTGLKRGYESGVDVSHEAGKTYVDVQKAANGLSYRFYTVPVPRILDVRIVPR